MSWLLWIVGIGSTLGLVGLAVLAVMLPAVFALVAGGIKDFAQTRIGFATATAIAATFVALGYGHQQFKAGEEHMAKRIAALDQAAVDRVLKGRAEVEACNDGVDWDVTTGTCKH